MSDANNAFKNEKQQLLTPQPPRQAQFDRSHQFINSASQMLKTPILKENVFDQIYDKLSVSSKSYVTTQKKQNSIKNGFLFDEISKKNMDDLMGEKWGERVKVEEQDQIEEIQKFKRNKPSYTQSIDCLMNTLPQQLIQGDDSQITLKSVIAAQVATQVKDSYLLEENKEKQKLEAMKQKVFFKQQDQPLILKKLSQSEVYEQKDCAENILAIKRPILKFKYRKSEEVKSFLENEPVIVPNKSQESMSFVGNLNPLLISINNPKNMKISRTKINQPRSRFQYNRADNYDSNNTKYSQELSQENQTISANDLEVVPTQVEQLSKLYNQSLDTQLKLNQLTDWNFQNKVYLSQMTKKKTNLLELPFDIIINPMSLNTEKSEIQQQQQQQQQQQNQLKSTTSAFRHGNHKKQCVQFNTVAYVLFESGEQVEELVKDNYRIKKRVISTFTSQRDLEKYWNF